MVLQPPTTFKAVGEDPNKGLKDAELQELLLPFEDLFKVALPPGLPPKRAVDRAIEID